MVQRMHMPVEESAEVQLGEAVAHVPPRVHHAVAEAVEDQRRRA